ncbi:DUF547 domain-containing protein [Tsuneonella sp. HG249]
MRTIILGVAALTAAGTPIAAQAQARLGAVQAPRADEFAQFAPTLAGTADYKLDYGAWDTALDWFVLTMGKSLREFSSRPQATSGSRLVHGHDSPYRLEGSRVAFSLMPADVKQWLTDYRSELEQLPQQVPLTKLSRNEQLAYWINLHNVAMIEQLALNYPLSSPDKLTLGSDNAVLDEARFITVAGVRMSPKDIRTRIVYPHWRDPKVIYGFWRGDIGSPSINRSAYSAANLGELLDLSAREFVNSLRGTEARGGTLHVSRYYQEARPFYFANWETDLREHLTKFAKPEVAASFAGTTNVAASIAVTDIADLSKGERDPQYSNLVVNDDYPSVKIDGTIARLMSERSQKLEKIWKENGRQGRVIFQDVGQADKPIETVQ